MAGAPALIGKAGETLVAAELMRRGIEIAYPASDVGVDLLAYRLEIGRATAGKFIPIQVKARAKSGYNFQKSWFTRAPGVMLIHVWYVATTPQFYVFRDLQDVEAALDEHAKSSSWHDRGGYSVTNTTEKHLALMQPHRDQWDRIINQLSDLP
jgi:hypothetical protein